MGKILKQIKLLVLLTILTWVISEAIIRRLNVLEVPNIFVNIFYMSSGNNIFLQNEAKCPMTRVMAK